MNQHNQSIELNSNLTQNSQFPDEEREALHYNNNNNSNNNNSGLNNSNSFGGGSRRKSSHIVVIEGTQKIGHYLGSMGSKIKSGYQTAISMSGGGVEVSGDDSKIRKNKRNSHDDGANNINENGNLSYLFERIIVYLIYLYIIFTFPLTIWKCFYTVYDYQRIVIFRFGRLYKNNALGAGIYFILPIIEKCVIVDTRTISFNVEAQEILSKDSVTIHVDAVVYYRVNNALIAVTNVQNFSYSTRLLAATTLRTVLGTKNLTEILSDRESIRKHIEISLDEVTEDWGVKVERVEIKDAKLPTSMQRAMAAEAESTREAKAKVIAAEGEQRASKAMRLAADELAMAPQAIQLRYLQTLHTIAAEKNSTIIFPLPMDLSSCFQAIKTATTANCNNVGNSNKQAGGAINVDVCPQRSNEAIIEMLNDNISTPGSSRNSQ